MCGQISRLTGTSDTPARRAIGSTEILAPLDPLHEFLELR